jgi:alpha-L-fucosidase 2
MRLARVLAAGLVVAVAAAQSPTAPRLIGEAAPPTSSLSLWYRAPASDHPLLPLDAPRQARQDGTAEWVRALPLGNGRLGAMVFGGIVHERLQLNEDTLWAGRPYDPVNPDAKNALPEVRRLIAGRKYSDAATLVGAKVMSKPLAQMPYQTVGDLALTFPQVDSVENYRRDLDLATATAHVSYVSGGVSFSREVFASAPDQVIVVRLTASRPGQISFDAQLQTPQRATVEATAGGDLVMRGVNGDGAGTTADGRPMTGALRFEARVRVLPAGGTRRANGNALIVRDADAVTLLISAATSYRTYDDVSADPAARVSAVLDAASRKNVDTLRTAHVRDYQQLFNRVTLDLGRSKRVPTDERVRQFSDGGDPGLAALYFQYGRYLLIASSRPGSQPANLQGLWNESMSPPWGSKYTININTEMNYWPALSTNLAETMEPLAAMVSDLSVTGARTAKEMYGADGWVAHHNTDLWRATGPIDGPQWGMWPTGGAWLTLPLWERYAYTGDREYLQRIYPVIKGAAQFFLDTLVEEPAHHWLVTSPSLSPENLHPFGTSLAAGPAMDGQILRELFGNAIDAAGALGVDADLRQKWSAARTRLAPLQIGSVGQLQEWLDDWDAQAPEIHHRHVSHLFGLFPGHDIDVRRTPELAAAVKRSLAMRGDQATGWATAWRINLWARLADGDHAYEILKFLLGPERTYPNLFDAHPPFQIDGNFGGTSAIAEMLLQDDAGEIRLLPALPSAWPDGSVTGLRARGGFEIDLAWTRGALERATVRSLLGRPLRLHRGTTLRTFDTTRGATLTFVGDDLQPHGGVAILQVDADRRIGTIDRNVYGQFLEHINHSVEDGLFAEQIRGAGFEGSDFDTYWTAFGLPAARVVDSPFERGTKSVRITADGQLSGIRQRRISVEAGQSYDGSLWVKIEAGAPRLSWRVRASGGTVLVERPLPARGSAWAEVPFTFTSARTDRDATVEIAAAGRGVALVDFVSLMRTDVRKSGMLRPDLLASLRGLAPTFIRWPGGSFASTYKWQDGIGPFASRVYHPNEIWGGYSDYYGFGTDEYLELTRQLGADPLIVLPAPDETPAAVEYAMNWVHYVNDPATTTWGQMRARNGHPDPYRVRYFQIDNEPMNNGFTPGRYAAIVNLYGGRLRQIAPGAVIIACGQKRSNDMAWSETVIDLAGANFDVLGVHNYEYESDLYESGVRRIRDYLVKLRDYVRASAHPGLKLAVLEWNLSRTYDWRAGLHAAGSLILYESLTPELTMTAPALLMRNTTDDPTWTSLIYHDHVSWFPGAAYVVDKLFREHFAETYLASTSGTFRDIATRGTFFSDISQMKPEGWQPGTVDAIATGSADGRRLVIKAVNYRDSANTLLVHLQGRVPAAAQATLYTITAALHETASLEQPDRIKPVARPIEYRPDLTVDLEPYTVAVLEIVAR